MDIPQDTDVGDWMPECKQLDIWCCYIPLIYSAVYHINWLQAKAAHDRWSEEVELLTCEFQWTVRFFQTKSDTWKGLHNASMENGELGHACYSACQAKIYIRLQDECQALIPAHLNRSSV